MDRPHGPLQHARHAAHVDGGVEAGWIDFHGLGCEHEIHPRLAQQPQIAGHVAGIAVQVLAGAELGWIDEDGHRRRPTFSLGPLHQAEVAGMKEAHGGHEAETGEGETRLAHLRDGVQNLHGSTA